MRASGGTDGAQTRLMPIESARSFFEALAGRGQEPRLANVAGTWELDVEGAGTWTVDVDHGALRVTEGKPPSSAGAGGRRAARIRLGEGELLRLVRGDGHENLFTALVRGALVIEGELAFAQTMQAILPVPEEWSTGS